AGGSDQPGPWTEAPGGGGGGTAPRCAPPAAESSSSHDRRDGHEHSPSSTQRAKHSVAGRNAPLLVISWPGPTLYCSPDPLFMQVGAVFLAQKSSKPEASKSFHTAENPSKRTGRGPIWPPAKFAAAPFRPHERCWWQARNGR